jgi:oxysterol-binding protein-related protein 3/6/7
MRNLMVGQKYVEHVGKMVVENTTTKMRCELDFKQAGYWGPSNVVAGDVLSMDNKVLSRIDGKWDDQLARTLDASQKNLRVLWKAAPFPRDCDAYYGFTAFGITLNEINPEIRQRLPPTDSRFRPDVRALEEGNIDLAEEEKVRVEEQQRERRRQGQNAEPRWFREQGEEWVYTGGYWEQRAKGWDSSNIQPLW